MEIEYIESAARLLDRACVSKRGLDLSKEILWVSLDQRAAEVPAVKVGGQKKMQLFGSAQASQVQTGPSGRMFL